MRRPRLGLPTHDWQGWFQRKREDDGRPRATLSSPLKRPPFLNVSTEQAQLESNTRILLPLRRLTRGAQPYLGNTRSEEKNTILYSDLASKWNILGLINGISLNILGYSMIFHLWASPRNIHIRIPHVGAQPFVGNPRSEENHPESRFFLAHFMNRCTWIQRNPRGLPLASPNESRIHWVQGVAMNPESGIAHVGAQRVPVCLGRLQAGRIYIYIYIYIVFTDQG